MKRTTVVWLLWLTTCGTANVLAGNGPQTEFVVPIKLYDDHLIVVRGGLGTLQDRNLIIDTGAYPSAIDVDVARKLKLRVNRGQTRVLGRNLPAGASIISQVEVGPLKAGNLPVVVEDLSKLSADLGLRVDALIGLDVLARANFQIDYMAKELIFGAPAQFTFSTALEARQSMACVAMNVKGHSVHLLIDTGAAKTVLFAQRVPWLGRGITSDRSFDSLGSRLVLERLRAKDVELGGARIATEDIFISDVTNLAAFPIDGVMATWGTHFRKISFDFDRGIFGWEMDRTPPPSGRSANATLSATERPTPTSEDRSETMAGSVAEPQRDTLTEVGLESQ
jgi:hypothetical protein